MHKIYTLDNSLRVVFENIPYVKSVTLGVWVGAGSVDENAKNNGVAHFIEHMLFKGTKSHTAKQLAECIDDIGGQLNAFTGRECTCYYSKTLGTHLGLSINLLADMLFNSRFDEKDIKVEKDVILEEINMYEDSPEELVHDAIMSSVWNGDKLGQQILGSKEVLLAMKKDDILRFMSERYTPQNSVISVVGNFDEDELLEKINCAFGSWAGKSDVRVKKNPGFTPGMTVIRKDIEQAHVCVGFEGVPRAQDRLYDILVMNNIFGSGMSSRLFQRIREEKGLAYSVYSFNTAYNNAGMFGIYAGMKPSKLNEVVDMIKEETAKLVRERLSEKEIAKSKEQIKSSFILGLESTSSRMNAYGKALLLQNKIRTMDDMIEKLDAVNSDSVDCIIDEIFNRPPAVALVGDVDGAGLADGWFFK